MPFKIKAQLRAELRDPQGNLIKRLPWKTANSLLKQFIQLLAVQVGQAALTIKNIAGDNQSVSPNIVNLAASAAAANTGQGIVIGTGTNAVTMTDYKLQTQTIANITHGVVTFAVETPDANTYRLAIQRVFTNQTGSTLSIREVGLYARGAGVDPYFCIERTLYSVDVPNGIAVTLTYRITISL